MNFYLKLGSRPLAKGAAGLAKQNADLRIIFQRYGLMETNVEPLL